MTWHRYIWTRCLLLMTGIISITFVINFYYTNCMDRTVNYNRAEQSITGLIVGDYLLRHSKFHRVRVSIYGQETIELSFSTAITEKFHQVLPRAAFVDKRFRGEHKNATVVLAHLTKPAKVVACKVNGYLTKAVEVKQLKLNPWLHQKFKDCTHDNVLVVCYDTPGLNNSKVSIVYKNPENESQFVSVESEYPLFCSERKKVISFDSDGLYNCV